MEILDIILNHFDFGLIISINVIVYVLIKLSGFISPKIINIKWYKIVCTIIVCIGFGLLYKHITDIEDTKLLNSCICAPVIWDWILKPILHKFKIDYNND